MADLTPRYTITTAREAIDVIEAEAVRAEGLGSVLGWLSLTTSAGVSPAEAIQTNTLAFLSNVATITGDALSDAAGILLRAHARTARGRQNHD